MKKRTKERYNFTINKVLMAKFQRYSKKTSISMSSVIERLVKIFLKKEGVIK